MGKSQKQFEKEQEEALAKACPKTEEAPKAKHVRSAIITTWEHNSGNIFWTALLKIPLGTNQVMCWKATLMIHKLLHDGHPTVIPETYRHKQRLLQLAGLWAHQGGAYSPLIASYISFLSDKLEFHNNHRDLKGDLNNQLDEFQMPRYANGNEAYSFIMSVMDLQDSVLRVGADILGSLTLKLSQNQTECRIAALQPLCWESRAMYFLAYQLLQLLHTKMDSHTLSERDQMFVTQWYKLKKFYFDIDNLKYLKGLVQVPDLSDKPPLWLQQFCKEAPPPPVDKFSSFGDIDQNLSFAPNSDLEAEIARLRAIIKQLLAEIERLKAELARKQQVIDHLKGDKTAYDTSAARARERFQEMQDLIAKQQKQLNSVQNASEELLNVQKESLDFKDRFNKLSSMYSKLRNDHVSTLKGVNAQKQALADMIKEKEGALMEKDEALIHQRSMALELENLQTLNSELLVKGTSTATGLTVLHAKKIDMLNSDHKNELKRLSDKAKMDLEQLKHKLTSDAEEAEKLRKEELKTLKREQLAGQKALSSQKKLAINELVQDGQSIIRSAIELFDSGNLGNQHCTAEYTLASVDQARNSAKVLSELMQEFYEEECELLPPSTLVKLPLFASTVADLLNNSKGSLRLANDDTVAEGLVAANKKAASAALNFLKGMEIGADDENYQQMEKKLAASSKMTDTCFDKVASLTNNLIVREVEDSDQLGNVLQDQMKAASAAIHAAAQRLEEMLAKAKREQQGLKLNVNESILGGSGALMECIRVLIEKAVVVQHEIVEKGRGSGNPSEFYRQNHAWTEGLISAAKSVGWGANVLVESADEAVGKNGKFEAIVAAANEVMSSTVHLVTAARVKAERGSNPQKQLENSSKDVRVATKELVKAAKNASQLMSSDLSASNYDDMSVNQKKREEMQKQIRVLELEKELESTRQELFKLRKMNYANIE